MCIEEELIKNGYGWLVGKDSFELLDIIVKDIKDLSEKLEKNQLALTNGGSGLIDKLREKHKSSIRENQRVREELEGLRKQDENFRKDIRRYISASKRAN